MPNRMLRWAAALAVGLGLAACSTDDHGTLPKGAEAAKQVRHVFVIVLENKDYEATFDPNGDAPYLAKTLPSMGQLLSEYYGIAHNSLPNYIALVGGQSPNAITQLDCQAYTDFVGTTTPDANGQVTGQGCVYPAAVKTIADQLQAAGFSWKGYMEDMGADPTREAASCGHPALNAQDNTQSATASDQYATRHNPFMYYHSIIDNQANCDAHVVGLAQLSADLNAVASTPNYAFITPSLCSDGHDAPCADGRPGGLKSINAFLQTWVPKILASPAFQQDGLLVITFDESDSGAASIPYSGDNTACCNEPTGPNTLSPGIAGPGGGRVGAVLLSPFISPGAVNGQPYNHYALLRSIEDSFGLAHLGYAGQDGLAAFGADVYR